MFNAFEDFKTHQEKLKNDPVYKEEFEKKKNKELREYWDSHLPFVKETDIPAIPIVNKKEYEEYYIPRLITLGAIPKNQLKDGVWYYGNTKNTTFGKWNESDNNFGHWRSKFGMWIWDDVNHFEDDNGYVLFVPLREANKEEVISMEKI